MKDDSRWVILSWSMRGSCILISPDALPAAPPSLPPAAEGFPWEASVSVQRVPYWQSGVNDRSWSSRGSRYCTLFFL